MYTEIKTATGKIRVQHQTGRITVKFRNEKLWRRVLVVGKIKRRKTRENRYLKAVR